MSKYSQLITKLFDTNSKFVSEDFYEFVSEITKKYPNDRKKSKSTDQEGNEYVREEVAIFQDANDNKIAIMIIKLPSSTKVERARSQQRNYISHYLRNEGVFQGINSVFVAFYSDSGNDWRLSFIKQEFKLSETELDTKGRPKIINELTPAKRFSFLVESNSRNLTVKQRLGYLISERVLIADIEKAFSVEKVSKEFFEKYVGLYERLSKAFEKDEVFKKVEEENNNGDEHFRENFVKKLLGQIVFLYFLQKKGWLGVKKDEKWGDGDKNFLQNLFRECTGGGNPKKESGGKNFFNDYLEWLFYDNLNRKRENDYSDYFECRIPYLNGGLFEPINGYDWKGVANILLAGDDNNAIFRDIFETFDEYNFTVYENDPLEQDVAVDPEMLGKVFENLLPENERKGKGAFYTPREIVHYMCKESLKNHLMNKTGISEEKINGLFDRKDSMLNLKRFGEKLSDADRFTQFGEYIDYAEKIVSSLKTIKIVDPAVGSGAFPMGLLKEIVSLRKYLQESILLEENVSEYTIKKETLENCIYGVDLDPGAVEIAKLRFWLSLVIEEESKESIDPLPNLDYKIIQGNSLIEDIVIGETVIKLDIEGNSKKLTKKQSKEIGNASQIGLGFFADETEQEDTLKKLKFLHKRFFQEKDNVNKKKLKEEIDHVEKELIRISGEVEVNRIRAKIESIEGKYLLSGGSPDTKDSKEIERLSTQIQGIKDMEEKYKRDNVRTFFPWKLHFAEVFNENGGFDIVIGNPPYVFARSGKEKGLDLKQKDYFYKNYSLAKYQINLYALFLERGKNFLKTHGVLSYIIPNNWLTINTNKDLREFILKHSTIKIINCLQKVFDSASVDSAIVLFSDTIFNGTDSIELYEYDDRRIMELISKSKPNIFLQKKDFIINISALKNGEIGILVDKLEEVGSVLSSIATVKAGLMAYETGKGDPIQSDEMRINRVYHNKTAVDESYLKYLDGQNVSRYLMTWNNEFLKYGKNLAAPRKFELFSTPRILVRQIPGKIPYCIHACYFSDTYLNDRNSMNIINIQLNPHYVLAVLNSKLLSFWFIHKFGKLSRGIFPQFKINELEQFPIANADISKQHILAECAQQLIQINQNETRNQDTINGLEKKIDNLVYELYNLTPEEIDLVESSMKK